jgi:hypothetical protein
MRAQVEAARWLTYRALDLFNRGQRAVREISMAKLVAADLSQRVMYDCQQIFGGFGYTTEYPISRLWRDAALDVDRRRGFGDHEGDYRQRGRSVVRPIPRHYWAYTHLMNRREFLYTSAAGLALSATAAYAADRPRRIGIIGCGWYGKTDLFRLIQVSPVEVVSLCDVDSSSMLADAAELTSRRGRRPTRSRAPTATTARCWPEKDLDIVLVAHAGPLARAGDDRIREGRGRCLRAEADQRGHD